MLDFRLVFYVFVMQSSCQFYVLQGHETNKEPLLPTDRQSEHCLMNEGFFTCSDHSHCLHFSHVCDGVKDCQDNSDETGKCSLKCTEAVCAGKVGMCHSTPLGPYCLCPLGRKLAADNITCVDVNECDSWPPACDQLCDNNDGSYTCRCSPGYQLSEDLHHCYASPSQPGKAILIYTQDSSIMMLHVGHGSTAANPVVVYHARAPIYSLAIDAIEERIFWFCSEDHEIKAIGFTQDFSKNTLQRIVKNGLQMVNTMAYDWIGKNLYIGDGLRHRIVICSVDTFLCATMFTSNVLHLPRSLVVDPANGKLYWSECGRSKKIESSSMDGSNTITLVHDEVYCPNSLYIDLPTRVLYWTDPEIHLLESVLAVDGTKRRRFTSTYITNPVQLAIFEEEMYVAYKDKSTDKTLLAVSNKYQYDDKHQPMLVQLSHIPADMHIYHKATQMYSGGNPCDKKPCTGGLCVITDRLSYKCLCPNGKRLDVSQHNCVWNLTMPSLLVAGGNRLLRILPDSIGDVTHDIISLTKDHNITALAYDQATHTVFFAVTITTSRSRYTSLNSFRLSESNEVHRIFENAGWITDIAVDWVSRNIYWCDTMQGVIEMSRMDGTSRTIILNNEQIQEPNAIAIDPLEGKIYYSDCGVAPHVGICELDGTNCKIQSLGSSLKCVSDLFIDYQSRHLYWTDSTLSLISVTDLNSFTAHEIRHSPGPLSITLFGSDLYWLDSHYSDVLRQPKLDPYHDTRIKLSVKPLTDIVSLHPNIQPTGSNGCSGVAYGGCSHLCIARTRLQSVCMCPTGLELSPNRKLCIQRSTTSSVDKKVTPSPAREFIDRGRDLPVAPGIVDPFNRSPFIEIDYNRDDIKPFNQKPPPVFIDKSPPVDSSSIIGQFPPLSPIGPEVSQWEEPRVEQGPVVTPKAYICPVGMCANGNQCRYKNHQYSCICSKGWTGEFCDIRTGSHDDDDDVDEDGPIRASQGESKSGLIAGLVILFLFIILVTLGLLLVLRSHRRLRPGEVFSFMKLRYGVLRKSRDPKLETLINPACTDIVDNIYTDVNDILEQNHRRKIKPPSLSHSQSLDSVQSASCTTSKYP